MTLGEIQKLYILDWTKLNHYKKSRELARELEVPYSRVQDFRYKNFLNIIEKKCLMCGKKILGPISCSKFCSKLCSTKYYNIKSKYRKTEKICNECGIIFIVNSQRRKKYCSVKCREKAKANRKSKNPHPKYIAILCSSCGKEFICTWYHRNRKYCSLKCWYSANRKVFPPINKICPCCNKIFTLSYANRKQKYCCDKCSHRRTNHRVSIHKFLKNKYPQILREFYRGL